MFKVYVVSLGRWGVHISPGEAFEHLQANSACSWACLIESPDDEKIFAQFRPSCSWAITSAARRGYGKSAAKVQRF